MNTRVLRVGWLLWALAFMGGCQSQPVVGDHGPILKFEPKPEYPLELRNSGISGSVTVGFMVEANGQVDDIRIITSTHPLFTQSVEQAVKNWKYLPGVTDGIPVRTLTQRTIRFDKTTIDPLR